MWMWPHASLPTFSFLFDTKRREECEVCTHYLWLWYEVLHLSSSLNYRFDQGPMTSELHLKKSWAKGSSTVCSHSPILSPRSKFSNLFQSHSSLHLITWSLTPVSHNHQVSFSVIASHFPASSNCNASPSSEELSAASHSFFLQQHQSWLENPCIKKETEVVL